MDDKLKVFWNLDVLVKMCRSKSDGPSLRIEEDEILEKIDASQLEIEEIKSLNKSDILSDTIDEENKIISENLTHIINQNSEKLNKLSNLSNEMKNSAIEG